MPNNPVTAAPTNPLDNEDLYQSIILGGVKSPGQVTLSGHDRKVKFDVKLGPMTSGASIFLLNQPPVEFSASFYLLRDVGQNVDDYAAWPSFRRLLRSAMKPGTNISDSTAAVPGLIVYHPSLANNEITCVVVTEIGGERFDQKGGCTIVVKFLEFKPLKLSGGPAIPVKAKVNPNQDMQDRINLLLDRYKHTAWG